MDASPLARLPAELRVEIYELVLELRRPITLSAGREGKLYRNTDDDTEEYIHILGVTETCKAICSEAAKIFYAVNSFTITCSEANDELPMPMMRRFLQSFGKTDVEAMRWIMLHVTCNIRHVWSTSPMASSLKTLFRATASPESRSSTDEPALHELGLSTDCAMSVQLDFTQENTAGDIKYVEPFTTVLDLRNVEASLECLKDDVAKRVESYEKQVEMSGIWRRAVIKQTERLLKEIRRVVDDEQASGTQVRS